MTTESAFEIAKAIKAFQNAKPEVQELISEITDVILFDATVGTEQNDAQRATQVLNEALYGKTPKLKNT